MEGAQGREFQCVESSSLQVEMGCDPGSPAKGVPHTFRKGAECRARLLQFRILLAGEIRQ